MNRSLTACALAIGIAMTAGCPSDTTTPTDSDSATGTPVDLDLSSADVILGGLLYDSWFKTIGAESPTETFALYTETEGTKTGADTHRCKECHGWDYLGVDGRYAKGASRYTGVKGLLGAPTRTNQELYDLIATGAPPAGSAVNDGAHAFPALNDDQIKALVRFVQEGMIDSSNDIDAETGAVNGDASAGAALYAKAGAATCETCHGADGKELNFGDEIEPEYLGTLAVDNPWELRHKIRWGQPASNPEMNSTIDLGLSTSDELDIMAYCQTLPVL